MTREELHRLLDELPEDKLKLAGMILNEALNHEEPVWDEARFASVFGEDEDNWWCTPIKEEAE